MSITSHGFGHTESKYHLFRTCQFFWILRRPWCRELLESLYLWTPQERMFKFSRDRCSVSIRSWIYLSMNTDSNSDRDFSQGVKVVLLLIMFTSLLFFINENSLYPPSWRIGSASSSTPDWDWSGTERKDEWCSLLFALSLHDLRGRERSN